jgi:two-component system, NtrC family, sensor histidine kinase KinB
MRTVFNDIEKENMIGYGVVFALMGLVVAWAVMNLVSLGKATDAILSENYRSILAAENMVDALERQDSGILLMLLSDAEKGIAQFRENEAVFLEWLARAKDNITIIGEAELVRSIEEDYANYRRRFSSLTDLRHNRQIPCAVQLSGNRLPPFLQVRDACINLRNLNEETMYTASVRAGTVASGPSGQRVCCGVGIDCGSDFQPASRGADLTTDPAFHGGIPENFIGRLCCPGSWWNR